MKYSVCIDMLYPGKPLEEVLPDVKARGFDTIEFWSWTNKDLDKMEKLTKELGIAISAMCTKFFILNDASRHEEFLQGLLETVPVAKKLGVKTLITQVGMDIPEIPHYVQLLNIEAGLRKAAPILEENDITLVIEPLNLLVDHKGYSLASSAEAYAILENVNSDHVKMLFDIYHQQISEGFVCSNIARFIDRIGHFHCAGSRCRGHLDDGELNYQYVFDKIAETGYKGVLGLEYRGVGEDKGFSALPVLREI